MKQLVLTLAGFSHYFTRSACTGEEFHGSLKTRLRTAQSPCDQKVTPTPRVRRPRSI